MTNEESKLIIAELKEILSEAQIVSYVGDHTIKMIMEEFKYFLNKFKLKRGD